MKTKSKLRTIMICFVTIPLVIINIFINYNLSDLIRNIYESNVSKHAEIQSESIAVFFENTLNRAKEVASTTYIQGYTYYSNLIEADKASYNVKQYNSYRNNSFNEINNIKKLNTDVEIAMILNMQGIVIASSDSSLINTIPKEAEYLFEIADIDNGISAVSMNNINGVDLASFYVARNIYSDENEKQGIFVQLCNSNTLQRLLNVTKLSSSSYSMLVDSFGNVFEYPYNEINHYDELVSYKELHDFIENSRNDDNQTSKNNFMDFSNDGIKSTAYNLPIPNTNWVLISISKENDVTNQLDPLRINLLLFSVVSAVILIILIRVYVFSFTKPIDNIVNIVTKKQRGDQNARFVINTDDEFGQIGIAFNSMFDDVFESEQRYRTIVEMTDNIVFEINFKKNSVFISNNFNQKFSFRAKSDNLQDSFFYKGRIHTDDKERYEEDFKRILEEADYLQGEYRFKNIYGDFAWILIRATKFYDRDGSPTKVIGVIVDIDREKKSEMHLLQRANYDALTQLYNRATFIRTLTNEFELSSMRKTLDAVLFIDLDDFKHFNDEYGHSCGDDVLRFAADCLKEIVSEKGFAGRFGGDEFVVCLNNQKYFGDPGKIAQDIIDAFGRGFVSESIDQKLSINCSIGIAFFNENGKNCEQVLNAADEAMYAVKKHGKSNFGYATKSTYSNYTDNFNDE